MAKTKRDAVDAVLGGVDPRFLSDVDVETKRLMHEAVGLKGRLNRRVKDEEYDPEFHLARRYDEVMGELAVVQASAGKDGIEADGVRFRARLQAGRKTLDQVVLVQEMLGAGMEAEVVKGMLEKATKEGEEFWVREIERVGR